MADIKEVDEIVQGGVEPRTAQDHKSGQGQGVMNAIIEYYKDRCRYIKEKYKDAKIYKVIASNVAYLQKGDLLVETDDEVLMFTSEYFDEPYYGGWTDDEEEYKQSDFNVDEIVLVKEIKCEVVTKKCSDGRICIVEVQ